LKEKFPGKTVKGNLICDNETNYGKGASGTCLEPVVRCTKLDEKAPGGCARYKIERGSVVQRFRDLIDPSHQMSSTHWDQLVIWSADFPADDWRHVSSDRVYQLAIQRLEAKGKGILLLHDIQARTVAALPKIIRDLKARGYRIVHVVPATAELPATPTTPVEWLLHPPTETVPIARWPAVPNFVFTQTPTLPAPSLADLNAQAGHQPLLPRKTMAQASSR
jgi:hypothetical protein